MLQGDLQLLVRVTALGRHPLRWRRRGHTVCEYTSAPLMLRGTLPGQTYCPGPGPSPCTQQQWQHVCWLWLWGTLPGGMQAVTALGLRHHAATAPPTVCAGTHAAHATHFYCTSQPPCPCPCRTCQSIARGMSVNQRRQPRHPPGPPVHGLLDGEGGGAGAHALAAPDAAQLVNKHLRRAGPGGGQR